VAEARGKPLAQSEREAGRRARIGDEKASTLAAFG
jgi:hypothetical protein